MGNGRGTKPDLSDAYVELRVRSLEIWDPLILFFVTPLAAVFITISSWAGSFSSWTIPYVVTQTLAAGVAVLGRAGRAPWRGHAYALYGLVFSLVALGQYGPRLGVGVILSTSTAVAITLLSSRAYVAHCGLTVFGVAGVGLLCVGAGLNEWSGVTVHIFVRNLATLVVGVVVVGSVLGFILRSLARAGATAQTALARERQARVESERVQQELAAARRVESVGRLAAGVAHDVNNALSVIRTGIEVLRERQSDDLLLEEVLADMDSASSSTGEVVQDLMRIGRNDLARRPAGSVSSIVNSMIRPLRRLLPERVTLKTEIEGSGQVELPRVDLERALLNLVLNARDAIEGNGAVTFRVFDTDEAVELQVTDDGRGMDRETRERAFEAFFTTKGEQGNGLGLSTTRTLVTGAGGEVTVSSEPGVGTSVNLRLPRIPEQPQAEEPVTRTISRRPRSILLVEDEPTVRRGTRRLLVGDGHQVVEAACEAEAQEIIAGPDHFDVLITDAVMPDSDAARLIQSFARRFPAALLIVCSGWVEEELLRQGIRAGECTLLQKPFSRQELREALALAQPGQRADPLAEIG